MLLSSYQMRIISWNCNMAFRKKAHLIIKEHPDVLIIQECEHIDKIETDSWDVLPSDSYWYGNNLNKGVAVFTFNDYRIDLTNTEHNKQFEFVIPMKIAGKNKSFNLYAVWTQKTYDGHYTRQIYRAVEYYASTIKGSDSILIGDLNSSSIWDKPNRETNHTNLIALLGELNICSAYHLINNEPQGKESVPTLYFQRHRNKAYHIDYCFLTQTLLNSSSKVVIGKYDDWISHSDHMPLFIDIDS